MNSADKEIADRRRGRRPGKSRTRERIAATAARQFAKRGYDRTTIRSIAAEAGVDAALVPHYFGSKQELFVAVVELPFDPAAVAPAVLRGDPDGAGERFASFLLGMLDRPEARDRIVGLIRAASSEPNAARMVRDLISRRVMSAIVSELGSADADVRANLVGSQVVGMVMARYIVRLEPLASLPAERVAAAIAPNLQRYLTGSLSPGHDVS